MNNNIEMQKIHYKGATDSLCRKCCNFDQDCFYTEKSCGPTKDASKKGYSKVEKCNLFNKPITKEDDNGSKEN